MESEKIFYSGILFKCPLGQEKSDCPFIKIRQLNRLDRILYYEKMDKDEFKNIIKSHNKCSYNN